MQNSSIRPLINSFAHIKNRNLNISLYLYQRILLLQTEIQKGTCSIKTAIKDERKIANAILTKIKNIFGEEVRKAY